MGYTTRAYQRNIILCVVALFGCVFPHSHAADVLIEGRVPGCGDGVVEVGESCDLTNMNGQSCTTLGFSGGVLNCTSACAYDTAACTVNTGGGGSGGGGSSSRTGGARSLVAFNGYIMPLGQVTLLVDGSIRATTTADQIGRFRFTAVNLARGTYQFGLYATDSRGLRSNITSFRNEVQARSVLAFDNVVLSPTLSSNYTAVTSGTVVDFFGSSIPNARISFFMRDQTGSSLDTRAVTTTPSGTFQFSLDTAGVSQGIYTSDARTFFFGTTSIRSNYVTFTIGTSTVRRQNEAQTCPIRGDLTKDCKVNLVDFSVLIFWYQKPLAEHMRVLERERLSSDGQINLVDFSILLHEWTG